MGRAVVCQTTGCARTARACACACAWGWACVWAKGREGRDTRSCAYLHDAEDVASCDAVSDLYAGGLEGPRLGLVKGRHVHAAGDEAVARLVGDRPERPLDPIEDVVEEAGAELHGKRGWVTEASRGKGEGKGEGRGGRRAVVCIAQGGRHVSMDHARWMGRSAWRATHLPCPRRGRQP